MKLLSFISVSYVLQKTATPLGLPFYLGSIISVVGKTTVEIMELFQCTQKVP